MKLFEIKATIEQLAAEYIKQMTADGSKASQDEFGADFEEICSEPGNCAMVSDHFDSWLNDQDVRSSMLTGYIATNPKWAKEAGVRAGSDEDAHTVVKVGDKVVDFTARQFDKKAKFPKITSYSEFKSEWKELDKTTQDHPY